jgi:hypothetical protein
MAIQRIFLTTCQEIRYFCEPRSLATGSQKAIRPNPDPAEFSAHFHTLFHYYPVQYYCPMYTVSSLEFHH